MSPAWGHLCLSSLLTTAPGSRHTDAPKTPLSVSSCASDLCAEYLHRLRSEYYQLHTSSFGSKNSHFVQFEKAMKPTDLHLEFFPSRRQLFKQKHHLWEACISRFAGSEYWADTVLFSCSWSWEGRRAWRRHVPCVRLGWGRPGNASSTYRRAPEIAEGKAAESRCPHAVCGHDHPVCVSAATLTPVLSETAQHCSEGSVGWDTVNGTRGWAPAEMSLVKRRVACETCASIHKV